MPAQSSTKSALHSPPAPSGYCALSSSSLLSVFVTSHPTKTAAPTEAPLLVLPGKTGENLTRIVTLPTRPPPTNPLFKKETVRRTRKSVFHFLPSPQPTSTSPHFEASRKNLPRQTLCEWYYYMLENNDIEVFLLFFCWLLLVAFSAVFSSHLLLFLMPKLIRFFRLPKPKRGKSQWAAARNGYDWRKIDWNLFGALPRPRFLWKGERQVFIACENLKIGQQVQVVSV